MVPWGLANRTNSTNIWDLLSKGLLIYWICDINFEDIIGIKFCANWEIRRWLVVFFNWSCVLRSQDLQSDTYNLGNLSRLLLCRICDYLHLTSSPFLTNVQSSALIPGSYYTPCRGVEAVKLITKFPTKDTVNSFAISWSARQHRQILHAIMFTRKFKPCSAITLLGEQHHTNLVIWYKISLVELHIASSVRDHGRLISAGQPVSPGTFRIGFQRPKW